MAGRTGAGRSAGPPGRDHRPDRRQDGDQRAELRRQGLARRPRGRQHPALGERDRGAGLVVRRPPPPAELHPPEGKEYALERRRPGRPRGASARLAPRREARAGRRRAGGRRAARLRAALLPQRRGAARARPRPVLLPAEDGEPPRGAAVERRLHPRAGGARRPVRQRPGDRADRDDPGRVRDGGDPLRAARARLRAERRPVGLPVQHDQELPRRRAPIRAAGPRRRDA